MTRRVKTHAPLDTTAAPIEFNYFPENYFPEKFKLP